MHPFVRKASIKFFLLLYGFAYFHSFLFGVPFIKDDFERALTKARIEGKPVMIFFYTDWCGWCQSMDRYIFSNKKMTDFSSRELISLRMNAEKKKAFALLRKYRVRSYPTVIFVNPQGKEIFRINGFVPPKDFLRMTKVAVQIYQSSK